MKTDLSNFSGWVIYEKGKIVATYDKENFHRYYDQEEIRILQQENKQLKEENKELNKVCELYGKSLYNADLTKTKNILTELEKYLTKIAKNGADIEKLTCSNILVYLKELKEKYK